MTTSLRTAVILALFLASLACAEEPRLVVPPKDVQEFYALPEGATVRLGDLAFRHGGYPTSAFSCDGKSYYTGGPNEVRVWDVASRQLVRRIHVYTHSCSISQSIALPDGNLVVQTEGIVRLVDPQKGRVLREIRVAGKENHVASVAVSPDGKVLAMGDGYGKILLQRTDTGEAIAFTGLHPSTRKEHNGYNPVNHLTFSPDGKRLLSDGFYDGWSPSLR